LYRHTKDTTGADDNTYDAAGRLVPDGVKDPAQAQARFSLDLILLSFIVKPIRLLMTGNQV
jgi:hypothetical protein